MPKIMRIFGNFEQFGKWSTPDPGFDGHLLLEEDGSFIGYLNELYGDVEGLEFLNNDSNNTRFITGYIANNNLDNAKGIAFLKLSRESKQSPLMYCVPNLEKEGHWAALGGYGYFEPQGKAKVSIENVEDNKDIVDKINKLHELIKNDGNDINDQMLAQTQTCLDMLQHVE